jgi:hypothetical protein
MLKTILHLNYQQNQYDFQEKLFDFKKKKIITLGLLNGTDRNFCSILNKVFRIANKQSSLKKLKFPNSKLISKITKIKY